MENLEIVFSLEPDLFKPKKNLSSQNRFRFDFFLCESIDFMIDHFPAPDIFTVKSI